MAVAVQRPEVRAGRQEWIGLAVLALPTLLVTMDMSVLFLAVPKTSSGLAAIVAGTTLIGLGVGPVGTLATDLIVGGAPPDVAGAASAISETGTELGRALGIAILGSVGAAVYRGDFGTRMLSADAPPRARETLAGAVSASRRLRAGLGDQVLATAHTAFVHGFRVASLLAAGLAFVMAALGIAWRDPEPRRP